MADELGSSVDNTPPVNCLARCLVKLNYSIDDKTLEIVKLVARHALDIKQQDLEDSTVLTAVFNLIEAKYPAFAINLLLIILTGLEIQSSLIDELKEYAKSEISKIPRDCRQKMDFILTVSCILRHLQKNQYLSLKEIARRTFLASYNSHNIKSRTHLLHLLLDRNCLTHESFRELFAWLEVVGCSCLQANLRTYCQRYNIEEPEWNSLVEPLKKELPGDNDNFQSNYPPSVPIHTPENSWSHSLPGPSIQRDGGPQSEPGSFIGIRGSPHESSYGHIHVNSLQLVEQEGLTSFVASKNPVPRNVVSGHEGRDFKSGTDEFTSSGSTAEDDHKATSNSNLPYPQPETAPEDTSKLDTARDVHSPRQIQQEQQQQKESAPPLHVPKANHDRRQLIEFKRSVSKRKNCILYLIVSFIIFVIIGGLFGGLTFYFVGSNPVSFNATLGANATVKAGCFDPFRIASFNVTFSSEVPFKFYLVKQADILVGSISLQPVSYSTSGTNSYTGLNYNYDNLSPLYTARQGILYLKLNFTEVPPNGPCLPLYLYNSTYYYTESILNQRPASGYIINETLCPQSLSEFTLKFSLPTSGFYYIGAYVPLRMKFVTIISADIATYITSSLQPHSCSSKSSCYFGTLSTKKVPLHSGEVCLLASTSYYKASNATLLPESKTFNAGSVSFFFFGIGFVILYFVCSIIIIFCCCFPCHFRARKGGYTQVT